MALPGGAGALLSVRGLSVALERADGGRVPVVRDLSFEIGRGEMVGLVGESGSGKTVTALALLRLLPAGAARTTGEILLDGQDLQRLPEEPMRRVRGGRIGMVFQEPSTALNPVYTVGFQIAEAVRAHRPVSRREAAARAEHLLELVALPDPRRHLDDHPHQLSGGQRQRVLTAIALASEPDLLIADEPTTALDVTVQAEILELLDRLRRELGLAVLLITHDLAVVAESCSRVLVMYAGQLVEEAAVADLFAAPSHPYTRALLRSLPRLGGATRGGMRPTIPGQVPALGELPPGCSFHPRCEEALELCARSEPPLAALAARSRARCFLHAEGAPGEGLA